MAGVRMPRPALPAAALAAAMLLLSACAIHHVTPYVPAETDAPPAASAVEAATGCFEASTAAERTICGNPDLTGPNRAMLATLYRALGTGNIFGRDAVLASQRGWLLSLPAACDLPPPPARAGPQAAACLGAALAARATALGTASPSGPPSGAIAEYVGLRQAAGAGPQPEPAFCADLAARAGRALRSVGGLDPAAMGADEIAGTHGPEAADLGRQRLAVATYDSNAYGLFQRRARLLTIDGVSAITPISLSGMALAQTGGNRGGRFSAYASQTGDYASLDVFRLGGRSLVLAADPVGFTTPAAPGESAHAGVWDIGTGRAVPACLFDIYSRPAEPGPLADSAALAAWRALLARLHDAAAPDFGTGTMRDQALLDADSAFTILHMPLLAVAQAGNGWTPWLRHRHDTVLDALFAWSAAEASRKPLFLSVFSAMRPAAADLVRAYQTTQGLSGPEATQAAGLAIMELLYQATATIAPAVGADLAAPAAAAGTRPRYAILASPQ